MEKVKKTFYTNLLLLFLVYKMEDKEDQQKVLAKVIIEMLGAPKEHIEKTLKDYVEKLKDDKDISIKKEEFAPAKQQEKLFSTFAELDIIFKDTGKLVDFCFDAMPSSVEIIEPEKLHLDSSHLTETLNDMQAKIHQNDMVVKTLKARNTVLDKNAKKILRNFVNSLIEEEPKSIESISSKMGITPEHLKPFIEELKKEGKIVEKEGRYARQG